MFRAPRYLLLAAAVGVGATFAPDVRAEDVYKWTDKNGVTHYADAPPDGTTYEKLNVSRGASRRAEEPEAADDVGSDSGDTATADGGASQPAASTACTQSRSNLEVLRNNPVVRKDIDGDGELDNVSGEQRQQEIDRAQRLVDIYCG